MDAFSLMDWIKLEKKQPFLEFQKQSTFASYFMSGNQLCWRLVGTQKGGQYRGHGFPLTRSHSHPEGSQGPNTSFCIIQSKSVLPNLCLWSCVGKPVKVSSRTGPSVYLDPVSLGETTGLWLWKLGERALATEKCRCIMYQCNVPWPHEIPYGVCVSASSAGCTR